MPSMNVKPEAMEFVSKVATDREITKEEALDVVVRAGIHRMKATMNYAKKEKRGEKKPRKAKGPIARKARKPAAKKKARKANLLD